MKSLFFGAHFERDTLPAALTQVSGQRLPDVTWEEFVYREPPARGAAVGTWSATSSDPLAEVIVVRDEDFSETLTWLNSYFSGLSPVTQWCHVLSYSTAQLVTRRPPAVNLGSRLGPWIGAILAECSVQAGGASNLRDISGSAALSTATFAAGRSAAVWGDVTEYREISSRHDELSSMISREVVRPLNATKLLPVWYVIGGELHGLGAADRNALQPLSSLVASITEMAGDVEPAFLVQQAAIQARDYFDLPELTGCADGPQTLRVKALDRLSERLSEGPASPAMDALLGLGASFIDPGSAVSPELLRRHIKQFPLSSVWQGVFAGAMMPFRVLTDQGGLGRLIAKALLADDDFQGRPFCDIAFEELIRWVTPGRSLQLDVRGIAARAINVELVPGVTCSFATSRPAVASPNVSKNESRYDADRPRSAGGNLADLEAAIRTLQQRVARLEDSRSASQSSLDFPEPKQGQSRKPSRPYTSKKT